LSEIGEARTVDAVIWLAAALGIKSLVMDGGEVALEIKLQKTWYS